MFHCNLPCSMKISTSCISDLETTLKHTPDIPIKIENHAHLSAAHYIISLTVHTHSNLLSKINHSSSDRLFTRIRIQREA
jgi:hypothetical protein